MQRLKYRKERKKCCYWCGSIYGQESIQLFEGKLMHPRCYHQRQKVKERLEVKK